MDLQQNGARTIPVYLDSLGCAKNLVDSEMALGLLKKANFSITADPLEAQVIIINTCGFIADAKEESINRILELALLKTDGNCKVLVVTGCLSEKYQADLGAEIPEIDVLLGTLNYDILVSKIADKLKTLAIDTQALVVDTPKDVAGCFVDRVLLTPKHTAYLKIAEGCNNNCSYCIIPQMRGRLKSRTIESLLAEAEVLLKSGVKELIVIAQDTTAYGTDIYGKPKLAELLGQLAQLDFTWIRVLYSYANRIDEDLLKVMSGHSNICPYMDIPLQHISSKVLAKMGRTYNQTYVETLFAQIRSYMPDIAIRTTFMVGFPGETEEDFAQLLDFAKTNQLAWAGVFMYSREEDTKAARMHNQVPDAEKAKRYNQLMAVLALQSAAYQQSFVGKEIPVLLEAAESDLKNHYLARSRYQAPGVDGIVYVDNTKGLLTPEDLGKIITAKAHTAETYDLLASPIIPK